MSGTDDISLGEAPHDAADVREAVAAALPAAEVRDATPVEAGKNTVYELAVAVGDERRDLVLKVGDHHFAAGCRAEPHLLEAVAARTAIPVPDVVGAGAFGDDPYFLAERVPGVNPACAPERLAPETFERVCVEAGRNLGALHDAFPADGWGMLGLEAGADDLHFAREFPDWPTYFEAWLTHNVERLADTRFADLRPELADRAESAAEQLRELGPFEPVVTHGDYRLANLLVDAEAAGSGGTTGTADDAAVTNAVLDWATPVAATPAWELAVTEAILVDWPAFDADRERRLRERLDEGYRAVNPDPFDREGFEARRRRCRFGARLRLMVNLDEEMAGRPDAAADARAREHRDALREFGVT